jgi:cysteine desulfurase
MDRVYLDYAASTPVDPIVVQSMLPFFEVDFGNPSSIHYYGQIAENAISQARHDLLAMMGADNTELIFTSGGTESDNLAIRGAISSNGKKKKTKILISPLEHPAVNNTCNDLADIIKIEKLRVDKCGLVDLKDLEQNIDDETRLVSVIWGNNEIGTINDVEAIGALCKSKGVLFHTDAVQAAAHLEIKWDELYFDMLSFGAHKFYGPKGIGGLVKSKNVSIHPQITGGGQENGLRAGTSNIPLIIGMVKAYELVKENRDKNNQHISHLRDILINEITKIVPGSFLTGHPVKRLPNHASFVFEGVSGQDLVVGMDMAGFSVSSGSACKVGNPLPSQVLLAIGFPEELARGALRVTVGKTTTEKEVRAFINYLSKFIADLRKK